MAVEITDSNFESMLNSGKPLMVDFWAQWLHNPLQKIWLCLLQFLC